jgi:3'-phosphoadenosine 5'-phosphosulfate sulfotransferase (PAPS reductase)/FAD synthetase
MNPQEFMAMQKWDYEDKVYHAEDRMWSFYKKLQGKVFFSLGGIDSATMVLLGWQRIDPDIPAVTISSIEDKSVQTMHKLLAGMGPVIFLKPLKSKVQVIREYGYPVIAKDKARRIEHLQKSNNPKQTFIHAIMTGDMGEQGKYLHSEKIKLPDKWIRLFGGLYNEHRPDLVCKIAPFRVSDRCCYWMKEKPADNYAKETGRYPYEGLMASEGGQRELGLKKNGCNYYGKKVTRSCPFAIFSRQDILRLALEMKTPIPAIYGEIKRQPDGTLETTRAKRTGCTMCGFGIHIEKRPHRFDRLRQDNPKEWEFWMYKMGWGKVLDYIGVAWEDRPEQQGRLIPSAALVGGILR